MFDSAPSSSSAAPRFKLGKETAKGAMPRRDLYVGCIIKSHLLSGASWASFPDVVREPSGSSQSLVLLLHAWKSSRVLLRKKFSVEVLTVFLG